MQAVPTRCESDWPDGEMACGGVYEPCLSHPDGTWVTVARPRCLLDLSPLTLLLVVKDRLGMVTPVARTCVCYECIFTHYSACASEYG
jgi:hypothetical protein